ncbi:MAG: glycoside hydrolase family 15 protein [Acidobacteria bacterium]|nr:glycoside hydrolase family 15 protein [Acidobacteriota bacterium]
MGYQPIENYGIIGDMHTIALVGMNGSIDWLCLPRFDSPSVFAAILDENKGGRFQIAPTADGMTLKQLYWPDTNILVSRFLSPVGVAEITDYMPIEEKDTWEGEHQLIRRVRVVRGSMPFRAICKPAFNYARDPHKVRISTAGVCFESASLNVGLAASVPFSDDGQGGVFTEFTLNEEQSAIFLLQTLPAGATCGSPVEEKREDELFERTVNYWRRWLSQCRYRGRWREMVYRSALVLKLLTYQPTGAIVAAPTCSLPEHIGGERNWDYRYTWIRDAAFALYALMRLGFTQEAAKFMQFLEARCHERRPDGSLQIMYGVDGRHELDEIRLDHLEGYKCSRPIRIGNAASTQLQLDIYGELMDSVYLYNKYGSPISYELWKELRELLNWVCENWQRTDDGLWEVRGGQKHFVYSKVMCWVALDRGLRLADKRSFPADWGRWLKNRDAIYEEVLDKGWNASRQSFVQYYGCNYLDASSLIMPLVFFMSPTDPRMLKTLDAINRPPDKGGLVSNSLAYRYHPETGIDGLKGDEGTFNMCTFWLVETLTRAGRVDRRRLDQAVLVFDKMLGYANHLGLYAEETGPCAEAIGNFPQAFTHVALISAAFNLDRALSSGESGWPGLAVAPW